MANNLTFNNNRNVKKVPINRNNMFFSEETFNMELEMGKEYMESDVSQSVILYQVDLDKTNLDDVYNESKMDGIVFKTPVEVTCFYEIESPQLRSYDKSKNLGTYVKGGNLKIYVYQSTLDELGADIRNGDYIGVMINSERMSYYTVFNDGRNFYDNEHSMYGYKNGWWRTIECSFVDENEFRGR